MIMIICYSSVMVWYVYIYFIIIINGFMIDDEMIWYYMIWYEQQFPCRWAVPMRLWFNSWTLGDYCLVFFVWSGSSHRISEQVNFPNRRDMSFISDIQGICRIVLLDKTASSVCMDSGTASHDLCNVGHLAVSWSIVDLHINHNKSIHLKRLTPN